MGQGSGYGGLADTTPSRLGAGKLCLPDHGLQKNKSSSSLSMHAQWQAAKLA